MASSDRPAGTTRNPPSSCSARRAVRLRLAQAAVGPLYCPGDGKLYIDLEFLAAADTAIQCPDDFAAGLCRRARSRPSRAEGCLSVMKKTQAMRERSARLNGTAFPCESAPGRLAMPASGRTMSTATRKWSSPDNEEAINAASAVSDDAVQRKSPGQVQPKSFTHGHRSSGSVVQQRIRVQQSEACDTFNCGASPTF